MFYILTYHWPTHMVLIVIVIRTKGGQIHAAAHAYMRGHTHKRLSFFLSKRQQQKQNRQLKF